MAVIAVLLGLWAGLVVDSWVPFAISVVIAFGLKFMETAWLHNHMHQLYEGEEDEHGIKTID